MLLDFLAVHDADKIYLVGDIFDGWRLRRGWHWPQTHNDVVSALLAKAAAGAEVILIPGNHDEVMRHYLGTHFGGIDVRQDDVHMTADGKRYFVTHGDQFDVVVVNAKWLAHIGDRAYRVALGLNTVVNRVRWLWGGQYWSLSNWAKQQVKRAVNFIGEYEKVLVEEARSGGFNGIICGHIHSAKLEQMGEVLYANTGDWVESCTAIVERDDGSLELIDWISEMRMARNPPQIAQIGAKAADPLGPGTAGNGHDPANNPATETTAPAREDQTAPPARGDQTDPTPRTLSEAQTTKGWQ